jgi:hypothetical protein
MPDGDALDLSRPVRGLRDLERLVGHVLAANPKSETDWLEWKVSLDLGAPNGRFSVSKQILGFGNRHPERAQLNAGGCSYVVLGAEPGNLAGQAPIDPADLEAALGPYVGQEGPVWTPIWVSVNGIEVLVILVEPPSWGDRIHTLKKGYENFRPGHVFIRRSGATHAADAAEIKMLETRLLTRPSDPLSIELLVVGEPPLTLDFSDEAVQEWLNAERERLLEPLLADEERQRSRRAKTKGISGDPLGANLEGAGLAASRVAAIGQLADTLGAIGTTQPEKRTPEEYQDSVEAYLAQCQRVLAEAVLGRIVDNDAALLGLAVRNPSDRNLPSVKVEVEFNGPVLSFDEDPEVAGLPAPPREWGPRQVAADFYLPSLAPPTIPTPSYPALGFTTRNHGSTTISYTPTDVRPRETVELDAVRLVIRASVGDTLVGNWTATSTAFDGVATGSVRVPLGTPALRPLDLLKG